MENKRSFDMMPEAIEQDPTQRRFSYAPLPGEDQETSPGFDALKKGGQRFIMLATREKESRIGSGRKGWFYGVEKRSRHRGRNLAQRLNAVNGRYPLAVITVGLTGGIASGKSVVARLMVRCGAHLIDADTLAKEAVRPGSVVWRKIVRAFGRDIVNRDREIDRPTLGSLIFHDPKKRRQLNEIVHPWVYAEYERRARMRAKEHPDGVLVFDLPLLFETNAQRRFDHVIVAYVDKQTQIRRIMTRNHLRRFEALERINAQLPLSQKRREAEYVIDTRISMAGLQKQVRKIYQSLT